jgi:hypothetical protein
MAREYARQKFLRLTGLGPLEEYITRNGWNISMPQNLKKKDFGVEADAIFETLPAADLKKTDAEFRAINELATSNGVTDMIEHGRRLGVDIMSSFEPLKTNQEKTFRCFLDQRQVFDEAGIWNRVQGFGRWQTYPGAPQGVPFASIKGGGDGFADDVKAYLRRKDGRGKKCKAVAYDRGDRICLAAYPEGHGLVDHEYADDNTLVSVNRKPVEEAFILYSPNDGSVQVKSPGGKEVADEVFKAFMAKCLGVEATTEPSRETFDLDKLKQRDFPFPYDALDQIEFVRLRGLWVRGLGATGRKYSVEIPTRIRWESAIWNELERMPISVDQMKVEKAVIQIKFHGIGRAGSVQIELTPNTCSLGDSPLHLKAREYLKRWGLVYGI